MKKSFKELTQKAVLLLNTFDQYCTGTVKRLPKGEDVKLFLEEANEALMEAPNKFALHTLVVYKKGTDKEAVGKVFKLPENDEIKAVEVCWLDTGTSNWIATENPDLQAINSVTLECSTDTAMGGVKLVMCDAIIAGGRHRIITKQSLDYALSFCLDAGFNIENSQEVLMWLHKNADFKV